MNYYDILFSKFLNKGNGGDTPSGGGFINPLVTVNYVNGTNEDISLFTNNTLIWDSENNTIVRQIPLINPISIPIGGNASVVGISADGFWELITILGEGITYTGSNEVNCTLENEDTYWFVVLTDPALPASITVTIT